MEGKGACQKVDFLFSSSRGCHLLTVLEECGNSMGKQSSQRGESLYSKEHALVLKVPREFSSHMSLLLYQAIT